MKNSTKLWIGFIVFVFVLAIISMPPTGTTSKRELKAQLKMKDLEIGRLKEDSARQADSTAKYRQLVEVATARIAAAEAARTQAQIQTRKAIEKYESIKYIHSTTDSQRLSKLSRLYPWLRDSI